MEGPNTQQPQIPATPVETPEPQVTNDRTGEQFEKLVNSNKSLAEENRNLKSIVESLRPENIVPQPVVPQYNPVPAQSYSHLNSAQVNDIASQLIAEDGTVDIALLNKTISEANDRAKRAEEAAKQAMEGIRKYEESRVTRQVHKRYPQLDPRSEQFDKDFYDAVRNDLLGQMVNEGKEDLMAAADKWSKKLYEKREKQVKVETQKAAVNSIQTTPSSRTPKYDDAEDLALATRAGSPEALKERLRRIGL